MSDFFTRLTLYLAEIFSNIPSQLRAFRYLILFIFIVLTAFFAAGLPKFQLDSSIETWLHEGDPSVKALENFKNSLVVMMEFILFTKQKMEMFFLHNL